MFVFQKNPPSNVDLKEIDIFTAPLGGSAEAWVQIWIWKEEMKRWKSSYQAPPLPPVMNEWEIDPEAGLSMGG